MVDWKEYIKQRVLAIEPKALVEPGSALSDLLINPAAAILSPFALEHRVIMSSLSMLDPASILESRMDDIAANFLVTRNEGDFAAGYVRLYFSSPQSVTVPVGTIFRTSDDKEYISVLTYGISRAQMIFNITEFPLYSTGDILVRATTPGTDYNINPGEIIEVDNISYSPTKIRNPLPLTGGLGRETNTELKSRIMDSVNNRSLASPLGIDRTLKELFPSIVGTRVIGAGHSEMTRDLSYSGFALEDIQIDDFYGKVSGLWEYPYCPSVAYFGVFKDEDPTSEIAIPHPLAFSDEFTTPMYSTLYYNDGMFTELTEKLIIEEYFVASGYHDSWMTSDGFHGLEEAQLHEVEVDVDKQAIRLGWDGILGWVNVPGNIIVDLFNELNISGLGPQIPGQGPWSPIPGEGMNE